MQSTAFQAMSFPSGAAGANRPPMASLLDFEFDFEDDEDEIFDRAVLALVALSTKRPYYTTDSLCDSLALYHENPADALVTPSTKVGRSTEASATARGRCAGVSRGQATEDTVKVKTKTFQSKKARLDSSSSKNSGATGQHTLARASSSKKTLPSSAKKPPASSAKKAPASSASKTPASSAKKAPASSAKKAPASASGSKSSYDLRWDEMVRRLKAYRAKHGDCLVPRTYGADPSLSAWVRTQRYSKSLSEERARTLTELGFVWSLDDSPHGRSKATKDTSGTTSKSHQETSCSSRPLRTREANVLAAQTSGSVKLTLSKAVATQLQVERKRKGTPSPSSNPPSSSCKVAKAANFKSPSTTASPGQENSPPKSSKALRTHASPKSPSTEEADRRWASYDEIWTKKFNALKAYHEVHGDTFVPSNYPPNQPLAHWIRNQRSAFRRGELPQGRIDRLDGLCADWAKPPPRANGAAGGTGIGKGTPSTGAAKQVGDESLSTSVVDIVIPETSKVVKGMKTEYTSNAADENKLVIASVTWSP